MRKIMLFLICIFVFVFISNFCSAEVVWEEDVRLTNASEASYTGGDKCITIDSQDRLHVVWWDYRDYYYEIYYKRSLDGGTTWESDTRLTFPNANDYSAVPSIATDSQDRLHVVWEDIRDSNFEIYYKRSPDAGNSWEGDTRLTVASSNSYSPSIATDSQNRMHVVWYDYRDGNAEIYYKRSPDGGNTWEPDTRLTMDSNYSWYPSIATDSQDRLHVVWHDYRDGNHEIYYKRSSDGGTTWEPDIRLTANSSGCYSPSIATDSQDRLHVVWDDYRDGNHEIYYKRSSDGGTTWESDTRLTVDSSYSWATSSPSIATDSQDRLHVVWEDMRDNNYEIYYKYSPDGGNTWEADTRLTVNWSESWVPSIATDSQNRMHVVWYDYRDGNAEIYYKRGQDVTYRAILVGISDYADPQITDLNYTDDDAIDIADVLSDYSNWKDTEITVLIDSRATKEAIEQAIQSVASEADEDDVCVFFFSGHGTHDATPIGYICPYDYERSNVKSGISSDELFSWISLIPGSTAVILDACFSGRFTKEPNTIGDQDILREYYPAPAFFRGKNVPANTVVMTASDGIQTAIESSLLQNGLFSWCVMRAWEKEKDYNQDRMVSAEETFQYAAPLTKQLAWQYSLHKQEPQILDKVLEELPLIFLDVSEQYEPPRGLE